MNVWKKTGIPAVLAGALILSGCGSAGKKLFEQANTDMEQGSYEYALEEYAASVQSGMDPAYAYRGMGVANMRMGNYEEADENFSQALSEEKLGKTIARDLYIYRATARLKLGRYEDAMADCQILARDYEMDADSYFLTGNVALEMDSYDEAALNFDHAYEADPSYDRAIQIYETYLKQDMEADGTNYLEAVLDTEPKTAQDYSDRGRAYYYMEDYANARNELTEASGRGNTEADLLLGMVYMEQQDYSNARAMFQQYVNEMLDVTEGTMTAARGYNGLALCDLKEGNYDSALENISSGIVYAEGDEMQSLLFNEAVVYEKKLDFKVALQKMQSYLDIYPEDQDAAKEIAFLKSRV